MPRAWTLQKNYCFSASTKVMAGLFATISDFFKDLWVILHEIRRPRIPYILLSCLKVIIGIFVIVMGVVAATTTPQYPMGAFWAGLFVSLLASSLQ